MLPDHDPHPPIDPPIATEYRAHPMPSENPLVSVLIPTRNRADSIIRCVEAIAVQTYSPVEVIVVDDNSDDDTPQRLERFANETDTIELRWFRNEPQAGANASRNRAIRESRGVFLAFLDDDCVPHPDWLEKLIPGFDSDKVAAVTGGVEDPPAENIYELTLRGSHRVHGNIHATRLVGCNMCFRREIISRFMLDEDRAAPGKDVAVSGRGDEDGLYLQIKSAGFEQHVIHDAVVLHEHHHSKRTFFRQAYNSGKSAAALGYKYHLPLRVELTPLLLAYLLIPLAFFIPWGWVPSAGLFLLFVAAIVYNDVCRKRKSIGQALITFPLLLVYYHYRGYGYFRQLIRFHLGIDKLDRIKLNK